MASTPSERLSLRLIGTGDFADTWGSELNSDTLALIDEAVSGVEEISLTGNVSLSTTQYVSNQSRNRVLRFTDGGLSSAPTITLPATERWYVIQNATGGTYALTFSNGSSTVTVAANIDTAIIWQTGSTLYGIDLAKGTDVATVAPEISNNNLQTVAGQISPTNNLGTVAGIASDVTTVSTNAANVTTVAGINSDVTTVAGIASDVSGVNAIASDVTAVNSNSTNINAVNSNATNINAVNSNSANINSVAGIASDVTTVAGISSDVTSVNGISSDVTSVSGISANVTTVAGISANVTTVAGISSDVTGVNAIASDVSGVNAIASDVTGVNSISSAVTAVDSNSANVNTVGTNISNVNNVGGSITSVNTVANNLTSVNSFGNTYQISTNNPTTGGDGSSALADGMLAWVQSADKLRVYNATSGAWEDAGSATNGTVDRHSYVATANQTTFPATGAISYNPNFVDVYLNGIKLVNGTDVTVSSGSNIVLASGAAVNDTVDVVAYGTFSLADMYTKTQSDNRYVQPSGNVATATTATNVAGGLAQGILYQSAASTTAHLAAGTTGQFLQTNGSGSAPTWVNAPAGSSIASTLKFA